MSAELPTKNYHRNSYQRVSQVSPQKIAFRQVSIALPLHYASRARELLRVSQRGLAVEMRDFQLFNGLVFGKSSPESMDFRMKDGAKPCKCSLEPIELWPRTWWT